MFKIVIFSLNLVFCIGEYQIRENSAPSYLYNFFNNLSEDLFPNDIIISISLSRVDGTLLYSLDSNNNQLIVSLSDADVPTLSIEFSKQEFSISIPKLCGVERGKYETIKLRIQMKKKFIHLQCNEAMIEAFKYQRSSIINKDYPIPKMNKTNKLEAHLWLVNTPSFGDILYNGAQLSGCIFDVWYNNKIINMESHNMKNTCPRTCVPGICYSGTCLETYNRYPLCNCTFSFKNGRFCNETVSKQNFYTLQHFNVKVIKLSFSSESENLFELNNTRVSLKVLADKKRLIIVITSTQFAAMIEKVVYSDYRNTDENIMIMIFNENSVDIKFSSNGSSWIFMNIPSYHDLSAEIFETLVLQSKEGIIDMVYKSDLTAIRWNKLSLIQDLLTSNSRKTEFNASVAFPLKKDLILEKCAILSIVETVQLHELKWLKYKSLNIKVNFILGLLIIIMALLIVGVIFICAKYSKKCPRIIKDEFKRVPDKEEDSRC